MRIGFGYDVHACSPERDLWLGGILLPEGRQQGLGLEGHSDADVLIHALCDAILGAANMRDIGFHFPLKPLRSTLISLLCKNASRRLLVQTKTISPSKPLLQNVSDSLDIKKEWQPML